MSIVTIAIAGLGSRGKDAYAQALAQVPERAKIVAIADPDAAKVHEVAQQFGIPAERCFHSAEALLAGPRLADALVLCTQDRQHVPRPFPPCARAMTFSWRSPFLRILPSAKKFWPWLGRPAGRWWSAMFCATPPSTGKSKRSWTPACWEI